MAIVVLRLPIVKRKSPTRLKQCPSCQRETFQRWGQVGKPVRDNRIRRVRVYRCRSCRRTLRQAQGRLFRHYPPGVDRADRTLRR